jgi:DNA-binding transcriptional regulator LsrR (DeoR family)
MQVAAAGEVADPVVVVAVAEEVEERQVYRITDTVIIPVTTVAIMANPVEKKRSPTTELVPLAGTSVADSAAEGHRRSRTMATKTEAALRFLFAMQRSQSWHKY